MGDMRLMMRTDDDQLMRSVTAPPDLHDGLQSLGYWRERSRRLPWYRWSARREAVEMTLRWEQRIGAALVAQRGVPAAVRLNAGLLLARARLGRWARRARIVVWATVALAATIVAIPLIAALDFLIHLV
jgi:hypothetical protein